MKTKNIFRMLLVAAVLLMGANNVKAATYEYQKETFADLNSSSTIRVSCSIDNSSYWQIQFATIDGQTPDFDEWHGGTDWGNAWYYTLSSHGQYLVNSGFDLKCNQNTVNKLKNYGLKIETQGLTVTSITIDGSSGGGGSTTTTDTPVWSYSGGGDGQWLGSWQYYQLPSGTFNSLKCDGTDVIRVYGKLGNLGTTTDENKTILYGIELVADWSDSAKKIKHTGTDNFDAGYYDFTNVSSTLANALKNNGIINGYNFYVTSIVINPSSTPVKQDVTLAFSASTATATIGEAFDEPTLTATADGQPVTGLNISYSSSNVSVATVDNYGNVDLISPGTATITASFAGNSNYNPATASYTLSVEAAIPDGELETVEMYNYNLRTYVTPFVIDFSRSVGVEGYYAKEVSGNDVVLYQVTGKCAANVPLLLRMTGTNAQVWKVSDTNATGITPTPNLLEPGPITAEGNNVYVLTYHNNNYVFAETEYVSAVVDATHAYLNLNNVSTARGRLNIKLVGESTGIISLQSDEQSFDGAIYNLRGQRVERPTKGLYIINGKKVLIK